MKQLTPNNQFQHLPLYFNGIKIPQRAKKSESFLLHTYIPSSTKIVQRQEHIYIYILLNHWGLKGMEWKYLGIAKNKYSWFLCCFGSVKLSKHLYIFPVIVLLKLLIWLPFSSKVFRALSLGYIWSVGYWSLPNIRSQFLSQKLFEKPDKKLLSIINQES